MFRVQFSTHSEKEKTEMLSLIRDIVGEPLTFVHSPQHGTLVVVENDDLKSAFYSTGRCGNGIAVLGMNDFTPESPELTIRFDHLRDAQSFKNWLCSRGAEIFNDYLENGSDYRVGFDFHDPGGAVIVARRRVSELETLAAEGNKE